MRLEFVKTDLFCLNLELSSEFFNIRFKKEKRKKSLFHEVRIDINTMLVLTLFSPTSQPRLHEDS